MSSQTVVHTFKDGKLVVYVVDSFNYGEPFTYGVFSTEEAAEACAKKYGGFVREFFLNKSEGWADRD